MFLDPIHEKVFYETIDVYAKEFGPEMVIVMFPRRWSKEIDPDKFKPMRVLSWEAPAVGIRLTNERSAHFTIPVIVN